MKNIIKIFFVVLLALMFASCTEKGPATQNGNSLNEALKLTVEVVKVEGLTATVRITSDGSDEDTWYGFATSETDVMKAYQDKIRELVKGGEIKGLKNSPSFMTQAKGLEPYTKYNYIVFGINKNGEIYGAPAVAEFTSGLVENENWDVNYNGKAVIGEGDYAQEYEHTVTVTSSDNNKYFITAYDKATYEAVDIKRIAEYELSYLKAWIENYNETNNTKLTINHMLFDGDGIDALNIYPGDWYAIAIGVNDKGELSGLYSSTEINIPEEVATEAYKSWLGKWTWTGENGVSWDVEFHKGINNMLYYMSGWEGFPTGRGLDIPVMWSPEDELWYIYTSYLGTFQFSSGIGDVYVSGAFMKGEQQSVIIQENYPICIGGNTEDGSKRCYGYAEEDNDGNVTAITHMLYFAQFETGLSYLSRQEAWPTFPITITEVDEFDDEFDEEMETASVPVQMGKRSVQTFTKSLKK